MQSVGIGWQLYQISNSPLLLGLIGLVRAVPFMTFSLAGGALADTFDRKRLLLVTQTTQMVVTSLLVAATATGHTTPLLLYGVTFLSGAAAAFDGPARQAMIPNLVPRRELSGAMTSITLLRRTAMIAGPGIGGMVIGKFGLAPNYFGNAISFLAVVVAVLLMGPMPKITRTTANNWERVLGGLHFARNEPLVMLPMLLDFTTRVFSSSQALLPIFARDVFVVGAEGLGLLSSAMSAGSVAAAIVLGGSRPIKHPVALMIAAYVAEGLIFACFGAAPTFAIAWAMLFLKGSVNVLGEVLRVTVLQLKTPDDVRGRVTALSGMFDTGGPQLGQLEAGLVAEFIGPAGAVVSAGIIGTAITLGFLATPLRKSLWETTEHLTDG